MKKIISVFDGLKYAGSTKDYSIELAQKNCTHIVGVFLDDPTYNSYSMYEQVVNGISEKDLKELQEMDKLARRTAAQNFEHSCQEAKLDYSVRHNHGIAIHDLNHESVYADLMVIGSDETFTHYPEKPPTRFISELLAGVQCPVILVPAKYKPIGKIVLLYDGAPSSVYAIKMFCYLLSGLRHLEVEVLTVNPLDGSMHVPDNTLMKEFIKRHFPQAKYVVRNGFAEDEIVGHLKDLAEHVLVVLGAYARGTVSRWFRPSMADSLMKAVKVPLFIAHSNE
jgi:nucleotide-binding universal stress UspA family protein